VECLLQCIFAAKLQKNPQPPNKVADFFIIIGSKWYEHEGFETDNAKRAFSNMMNHGLKQSSRLIIDKPELTDRYMLRSIMNRVLHGQHIDEVWLRNNNEEVKLLYKTTDG
jgi:hypothetical protein